MKPLLRNVEIFQNFIQVDFKSNLNFCFVILPFFKFHFSPFLSENSTIKTKAKNSGTHLLIAFNFATQGKRKPSKARRVRNAEPDNRKLKYVGLCSPLPREEANAGSGAGQLDQSSRGPEFIWMMSATRFVWGWFYLSPEFIWMMSAAHFVWGWFYLSSESIWMMSAACFGLGFPDIFLCQF